MEEEETKEGVRSGVKMEEVEVGKKEEEGSGKNRT